MGIRNMQLEDKDYVLGINNKLSEVQFINYVENKMGHIITGNYDERVGFICSSILWDEASFMNTIFIDKAMNNSPILLTLTLWENDIRQKGYKTILISTDIDDKEMYNCYKTLGYKDCGMVLLNNTTKIFMKKDLI